MRVRVGARIRVRARVTVRAYSHLRQARSGAAANTAAADPEAGAKRQRACVEAPHAEEGQGPSRQAGQRGVNSGQRAGAEVPASPLDWVMKYARITLVQLKVSPPYLPISPLYLPYMKYARITLVQLKVVRLLVHLSLTLTLALIRWPP